jgi:hypothetical protein
LSATRSGQRITISTRNIITDQCSRTQKSVDDTAAPTPGAIREQARSSVQLAREYRRRS